MVKNLKNTKIFFIVSALLFLSLIITTRPATAQSEKMKTIYFTPQIEIPFSSISGETAVSSVDQDGFVVSDLLARYIKAIYDYGIMVGGILAALMLMAGGLIWLTSGGDSGKVSKAKSIIAGSITGLVILMGTYFILNTINPDLVQMKGIKMIMVQNIYTGKTTCCHAGTGRIEFNTRKVGDTTYYYGGEKNGEEFLGCEAEASAAECDAPGKCFKYDERYLCYSKQNICCECRIGNKERKDSICINNINENECNEICNNYSTTSQEGKIIHYTLNISMPPAELFSCVKKSETHSVCEANK